MSWDIGLTTSIDGHEVALVEDVNYTHNCNPMIRAAGFTEWPRVNGMPAALFCIKLGDALHNLRQNPTKYRAMDPENGWGGYDTLLPVLTRMHAEFERFPSGVVAACI